MGKRNAGVPFDEKLLKSVPQFHSDDIQKLEESCATQASARMENKNNVVGLIGIIDLTTLSGDDTTCKVEKLVRRALSPLKPETLSKLSDSLSDTDTVHCAAVCTYPARLPAVLKEKSLIDTHDVLKVASVAGGFPSGQYKLETRVREVELAVEDGATEIDIVINRCAALEGDWKTVYDEVKAMRNACGEAHLKTILATGELLSMENIYKASMVSMMAGSDFIKTSTGKEAVNATIPVSYVMCRAIKEYFHLHQIKVGFKAAGGIKTAKQGLAFQALGITHKLYEQLVKHQVSEFSMEWNPNVELSNDHMHLIVQHSDSTPSKTQTPDVSQTAHLICV